MLFFFVSCRGIKYRIFRYLSRHAMPHCLPKAAYSGLSRPIGSFFFSPTSNVGSNLPMMGHVLFHWVIAVPRHIVLIEQRQQFLRLHVLRQQLRSSVLPRNHTPCPQDHGPFAVLGRAHPLQVARTVIRRHTIDVVDLGLTFLGFWKPHLHEPVRPFAHLPNE